MRPPKTLTIKVAKQVIRPVNEKDCEVVEDEAAKVLVTHTVRAGEAKCGLTRCWLVLNVTI